MNVTTTAAGWTSSFNSFIDGSWPAIMFFALGLFMIVQVLRGKL